MTTIDADAGLVSWEIRQAPEPYQAPKPDVPPIDRDRTTAHLTASVLNALAHASRHIGEAQDAPDAASKSFNIEHTKRHIAEATEHASKLKTHLESYYPPIAKELAAITDQGAL